MKSCFGILVLAVVISATAAFVAIDSGRPSCTNEEEVNTRIFRNNWDPTSYWKCVELNEAAVLERCPDQTAFLNSIKDCVSWDDWHWEEPTVPLTYVDKK